MPGPVKRFGAEKMATTANIRYSLERLGANRVKVDKGASRRLVLTQEDLSGLAQGTRVQLGKNAAARHASAIAASRSAVL